MAQVHLRSLVWMNFGLASLWYGALGASAFEAELLRAPEGVWVIARAVIDDHAFNDEAEFRDSHRRFGEGDRAASPFIHMISV